MSIGTSSALMLFAGSYAAMILLPGPNFLVVSRSSLTGRSVGTAAALGVATGAAATAGMVVLVLRFLSGLHPSGELGMLQIAFCLVYAVLLLRTGTRCLTNILRGEDTLRVAPLPGAAREAAAAFRLGLLTAASNPMSVSFFLAASGVLMTTAGEDAMLASPPLVFSVAALWFGALALLFSTPVARRLYLRLRVATDLCLGSLLLLAGGLVLMRVVVRTAGLLA